jgi:translation initiation factor IF-2
MPMLQLRYINTTSVPDRRKRNHFPHSKLRNHKKPLKKINLNDQPKTSWGSLLDNPSQELASSQETAEVFTNQYQNLLVYAPNGGNNDKNEGKNIEDIPQHQPKSSQKKIKPITIDLFANFEKEEKQKVAQRKAKGLDVNGALNKVDLMDLEDEEEEEKNEEQDNETYYVRKQKHRKSDKKQQVMATATEEKSKLLKKKKKDGKIPVRKFKFESILDTDPDLFAHIDWDEGVDKEHREHKRKQRQLRKQKETQKMSLPPQEVEIPTQITVKNLAERMCIKSKVLLRALKDLGENGLNDDSILTNDIAEVVVESMNMIPVLLPPDFIDLELTVPPADCSAFPVRPPVISVMGHVDHGKTTLLDALRKTKVAASEHGGITQSIGAFTVNIGKTYGKLSNMTFIDTPGHAAFSSMRARGSEVTDIIVLVVAADDGVRPQTVEVINLALKNNVPMVVAITKCDMHELKEDEVMERIGSELMTHGVVSESMGGDTPLVCVSGKTGEGLDSLKETIALHAEVMDLRADTKAAGEAVVLEAIMARGVGVQVDAIVKWGTLKQGEIVVCGLEYGKIRGLVDQSGKRVKQIAPGNPVRVIGLKGLPNAGDALISVSNEEQAKEVITQRQALIEWELIGAADDTEETGEAEGIYSPRRRQQRNSRKKWEEIELRRRREAEEAKRIASLKAGEEGYVADTIPIIVKTDSVGVIAAIDDLVASLPSDEVIVKRILAAVGPVSSSDLEMAKATGATIYSFNVKHPASIDKEAFEKGVSLRQHKVVYTMLDDIKDLLRDSLSGVEEMEILGAAEVIQVCYVDHVKEYNIYDLLFLVGNSNHCVWTLNDKHCWL